MVIVVIVPGPNGPAAVALNWLPTVFSTKSPLSGSKVAGPVISSVSGSRSLTTTFVTGSVPWFVTVSVYSKASPSSTAVWPSGSTYSLTMPTSTGSATFVTWQSTRSPATTSADVVTPPGVQLPAPST